MHMYVCVCIYIYIYMYTCNIIYPSLEGSRRRSSRWARCWSYPRRRRPAASEDAASPKATGVCKQAYSFYESLHLATQQQKLQTSP